MSNAGRLSEQNKSVFVTAEEGILVVWESKEDR